MERVFSVDEIADSFWAASPPGHGLPPPAATDGGLSGALNRSPSEWFFEKFLEAAVPSTTSPAPPNPDPNPNSNPNVNPSLSPATVVASNCCGGGRTDGGRGEDDEEIQIEVPAAVAVLQGPPSDPPAAVNPEEHAVLLKQRLDACCAAVAMSRVKLSDCLDVVFPPLFEIFSFIVYLLCLIGFGTVSSNRTVPIFSGNGTMSQLGC